MKSMLYRKEIEHLAVVGLLLFATVSWATADDRTNAASQAENSGSVTNTGKTLRYDPNGPNPYKGLSVKELWERKPTCSKGPHKSPSKEEDERMKSWYSAMEATAPNPYAGKWAWQLRRMKPKMHQANFWTPENEEEWQMWQWLHAMRKADPDAEWKEPIEFYGIVVNQSNRPLPGITVNVQWSAVDGTTPKLSMETDANGKFSVSKITSKGIDVMVGKKDYYPFRSAHQGFEYFNIGDPYFHIPDPTNPVVFRLWEYVNPEPMYHPNVPITKLSVDDKIAWVDIKGGKIGDSGQVGISVLRIDPTNLIAGFRITIHAAEGGGIKTVEPDDELMFQAPENGYQSKLEIVQAPGAGCWEAKKARFYLRTPNHIYAAMGMEITQFKDATAELDTWVRYNPSGSRNLQYREDLLLRDKKKK